MLEEKVPLFCAGWAIPGLGQGCARRGMKVLGITGNAKNARRMAQSGIDLLVAQGHEGAVIRAGSEPWLCCPRRLMLLSRFRSWQRGELGTDGGWLRPWPWAVSGLGGDPIPRYQRGGALPVNKKHISIPPTKTRG